MPHLPRSLHSLAVSLYTIPHFTCHTVALPEFPSPIDMSANPHIPPIYIMYPIYPIYIIYLPLAPLRLMLCSQHSLVMFPHMLHPQTFLGYPTQTPHGVVHHPCQLSSTSMAVPQHYPASIPIFIYSDLLTALPSHGQLPPRLPSPF